MYCVSNSYLYVLLNFDESRYQSFSRHTQQRNAYYMLVNTRPGVVVVQIA